MTTTNIEHNRAGRLWNWISSHPVLVTTVISSLVFSLAFLVHANHAYFEFDDHLDSVVPWHVVLARSGQLFRFSNSAVVPNIMGGIPRNAYPGSLQFVSWIFAASSSGEPTWSLAGDGSDTIRCFDSSRHQCSISWGESGLVIPSMTSTSGYECSIENSPT